jgi:hypothetical protein
MCGTHRFIRTCGPGGRVYCLASKLRLEIKLECGAVRLVSGQGLPVSAERIAATSIIPYFLLEEPRGRRMS